MKYKGRQLSGPRYEIVVIPRKEDEGGNIAFKIQSVVDLSPFFQICPSPTPPQVMLPGGAKKDNVEDPGYKDEANRWWKKRSAWITIQSLRPSFKPEGDLEWETVKYDDPETWINWEKEIQDAGFADAELTQIITAIMNLNGLNERLMEEARKSFLTIQASPQNGSSSRQEEVPTTPSGPPASNSDSDLPAPRA